MSKSIRIEIPLEFFEKYRSLVLTPSLSTDEDLELITTGGAENFKLDTDNYEIKNSTKGNKDNEK